MSTDNNRLCYISRNYYNKNSAGNKAKSDYEDILHTMGAVNVGLPRRYSSNKLLSFFYNLLSVITACIAIRRGDRIVLQYPVKKYFTFICQVAHLKGAKTISLIHDLGSFRRHKLSEAQERKRLSHTDYIIATNEAMKHWLLSQDYKTPIGALGFHDYLSLSKPVFRERKDTQPWKIVYAGTLRLKKNAFINKMKEIGGNFLFLVYGKKDDHDIMISDTRFLYKGFLASEDFVSQVDGDFGLVWDGDSLDGCCGDFGSYLKYNTPHKASFYLRAGLPLIVWTHSAIAPLVEQEGVGLVVSSLRQIPDRLQKINRKEYETMQSKVKLISERIGDGYYLKRALADALKTL